MVLIYGENNVIKGKIPCIMKVLEERKRTIEIFNTPLKEILDEPQNIVEEEEITISADNAQMIFGSK